MNKVAGNLFGKSFKIITWGESHGKAVGVVGENINVVPIEEAITKKELKTELICSLIKILT